MSGSLGSLSVEIELTDDGFTTTVKRVGDGLKSVEQRMLAVVTGASGMDRAVANSTSSFTSWVSAIGLAGSALHNLQEVTIGWIEKIVEVNNNIENTTALLRGLSSAADEAGRSMDAKNNMKGLLDLAGNSPFGMEALTNTFVKLRTAGLDPLKGSMQGLTDAIAAFGGDDTRLTRAGYAIQEMAGRGVISLQNLRRQLGQDIPGAVELMATSMNVTVAKLDEMVTKGTLDSKNAIDRLLEEFERTYGGASVARLNTFTGATAQLNVAMQRLAITAGGMNDGADSSTSFYRTVVQGVQELTKAMSSPEFQAFAVTINQNLASAMKTIISFGEALIKWGDVLGQVAIHLTEFIVIVKTMSAIEGARNMVVAWATAAEGGVAVAGRLTMIANVARTAGTAIAEFVAPAVTGFMNVNRAILGAGAAMGGLAGAAVDMVAPLGAVMASLGMLAIPVAIIAGIAAIALSLKTLKGQAEETGEAIRRIKAGDYTPSNALVAATQLQNMKDKLALLEQQQAILDKIKPGMSTGQFDVSGMRSVAPGPDGLKYEPPMRITPGDGVLGDTPGNGGIELDFEKVKAAGERLKKMIDDLKSEIAAGEGQVAGVGAKQLASNYQNEMDGLMSQIASDTQSVSEIYRMADAKIEGERAATPSNNEAAQVALNLRKKAIDEKRYADELSAIQSLITQQQAMLGKAANDNDQQEVDHHNFMLNGLQTYYAQRADMAKSAIANIGKIVTDGDAKEYDKQTKLAASMSEQMDSRIAQLSAEASGAGQSLAKMFSYLESTGKLSMIQPEEMSKLLAKANAIDTLTESVKQYQLAQKGIATIDNGMTRQTEAMAAYMEKLSDPNATEAQRGFLAFQNQMVAALKEVGARYGTTAQEYIDAQAKEVQALNAARANAALADADSFVKNAERLKIEAAAPGHARVEEQGIQTKRAAAAAQDTLNQSYLNGGLSAEKYAIASKALSDALTSTLTSQAAIGARSDARATRPGDTAITDLSAKLAGLKAEILGTNKTYAEWESRLATGKTYTDAQGHAISGLAAEVSKYEDALKGARVAENAWQTLLSNGGQAQDKLDLIRAMNEETKGRGRLLDVEKQILEYRLKQDAEVKRIYAQTPTAVKDQNAIMKEGDLAAMKAQQNVADEQTAAMFAKMDSLHSDTLAMRESLGGGNAADRQAAAEQELNAELAGLKRFGDATAMSAQDRMEWEDTVTNYIAAKRADLDRKTEDGLMKLSREWGDSDAALSKMGGEAMNKIGSMMDTFFSKGKMDWKSFGDWAIAQLMRIAAQAALSPLLKVADQGFTDIISSLFGTSPVTSAASSQSSGPISAADPRQFHTGGMIGFEGAPRFHTGIGPDEFPAILQQGEGVFTAGQMAAIGNLNATSQMMATAVQAIASSLAPPANVANSNSAGPLVNGGATPAGPGNVTINLNNQSSTPLSAVAGTPQFDGEQWVLDVVIKNIQQPGQLRTAVRNA